jgi:hypothetical protein
MAEERINRKLAAICAFMNANSLRKPWVDLHSTAPNP